MSAEIIMFVPRPNHSRETDFPTIAFKSSHKLEEQANAIKGHADSAPSEMNPDKDSA